MRGKFILAMVLLCVFAGNVRADLLIPAIQSCRTEGGSNIDVNRHDSSKLSVRASSNGNKSWIKFDIGDLDIGSLASATLTVSLHEGKSGDQTVDVSFVNDDVLDNIGWDERSITWNNAPGNDPLDLGLLDTTKTTFLGAIAFTDGLAGDSFSIDILSALQSDTDGIVQFVLHNSSNLLNFSTHDHSVEAQRPFIDATIPEPATMALLALGGLIAAGRKRR